MFERIKTAYRQGKEAAGLEENLFWFHPHLVRAHAQYDFQSENWTGKMGKIEEEKKKFGLIEKIAYEIGNEMNSSGLDVLPLLVPRLI